MFQAYPLRRTKLAALVATALLASCAQPPPPAPPPPPSVSLSPKLIEQASVYRTYLDRTAIISPAFANGAQVAEGVRTGASYEPQQLARGAIVYGAIAALQDPAYVAGVRAYVADPAQRQQIAYAIMKDPAYAVGIQGSASAAGLVVSALGEPSRKLLEQGRAVRQAAYDVQRSPWSKREVAERDARLMQAKQLSQTPGLGETQVTLKLQQASVGAVPLGLTGVAAEPPYSPMVVRSLALAALAALGYADDAHLTTATALASEPVTSTCLNMSKLNLYQCLAVSKPYYEDVFCLGQHSLEDTGACLIRGAGLAVPPDPVVEAAKARKAEAALLKSKKAKAKPAKRRGS